jgi:hypothetical protein
LQSFLRYNFCVMVFILFYDLRFVVLFLCEIQCLNLTLLLIPT